MSQLDCCLYCSRPFLHGLLVELDHMDPKSKGGWDHPDNLVACCKKCNSKKKNRLFVKWLELQATNADNLQEQFTLQSIPTNLKTISRSPQ